MKRELRVASGAIIIRDNKFLLLRYREMDETTYLVGPGGRVEDNEGIEQAICREVEEETSAIIEPIAVLAIEDIFDKSQRMIKIWMLSKLRKGNGTLTQLGKSEGIIELGWYTKEQLLPEIVYPEFVKKHDISEITSQKWKVICYPPRIIEK